MTGTLTSESTSRREAFWALGYFGIYLASLFVTLENEWIHWINMVFLPAGLVWLIWRKQGEAFHRILSTFGIERSRLRNGIAWALILGIGMSALQLFLSRDSSRILLLFQSGKFALLLPQAILLLLITAGFTEEFFFRGFLQTRLQDLFRSKIAAVIVASVLFGLYHLPYAYLSPRWPSHGNFGEALSAALGQGIPIGLILGTLYARSKNNLAACVLLHSLINCFPAMLILQ